MRLPSFRTAVRGSARLLLLAALLGTGPRPAELVLYVSPAGRDDAPGTLERPFATLHRAREELRARKRQGRLDGPATVYLRGGRYEMAQPLVFTPEDSGTEEAPVRYAAYPGERPALSGGRVIAGWRVGADGVWTAELPEVRRGAWRFRQLYVDGRMRPRARIPDEGFLRVAAFPENDPDLHYHTDVGRFGFAPGDLEPGWTNLEDVEVIVYHFWTDSHLPIASIDTAANVVTFRHRAGKVFTDDFSDEGARYVVENVFEGMDRPGEWYLDRKAGALHYRPLPGEEPGKVEVVAPFLPELVRFEGRPLERAYVEHVSFRGLVFEYANWDLPPGDSNDRQGSAGVPAAVTLTGARHVAFDRNTVRNVGTFAVELKEGCARNRFTHNELGHLGAGGFRVGGGDEASHPLLRTGRNEITDNHLHHYGEVFPSAVGILLTHTDGNTVAHNHVHHGYYTGISVGWEWGYQRSVSRDNLIAYNHIHDIGQGLLSDMGGIYTLGVSPGTVIRGNRIHDVESHHYGGWGIYNDEGSTHLLVEHNLVYDTKFAPYNIHFAREVTVRHNVFAGGRLAQLSRSRVEPHRSVYFENNIVYWTEGALLAGTWADRPYAFHFRPFGEDGTRQVESTFDMDYNLYFNPGLSRDEVRFDSLTWAGWQARGKDVHSRYADPLFADPARRDFRLQPGSPAFALGFEPPDLTRAGPRPYDPARAQPREAGAWRRLSSRSGELPAPGRGDQQTASLVADADLDGVADFFITERTQGPSVVWFRRTGDGWRRYVVDDRPLPVEAGGAAHDVDGDGDPDVVFGGDHRSGEVWWWENPYPDFDPARPWTRRAIKSGGAPKHHDQRFGDFDGDGRAELAFWNQGAKTLFLAEIPDDPRRPEPWPMTAIYRWTDGAEHEGLAAADVDGDGKPELVGGGRWFRHRGGATFEPVVLGEAHRFTRAVAGQFVAGGPPEIVFVPGDADGPLVLFEARGDPTDPAAWTGRPLLEADVVHGHSLDAGDVDGDGHLDLFLAEMHTPGHGDEAAMRLLYGDGRGGFRLQELHRGDGNHESRLADLDGDGDLDILSKPYTRDAPRLDVWLNPRR